MELHKRTYTKFLSKIRINKIAKKLDILLKDSRNILDIGCGNGNISCLLMKYNPNLKIQGIDILKFKDQRIPAKTFNGKDIPFENNTFDTVMLIDMLHHTNEPEELLKESIRVSKKYIIIKDHYYKTKLDYLILKIYDYIGNKPFGVNLPYNFKKTKEWKDMISKNKLTEIYFKKFKYDIGIGKQIIMKLKKE